MAQIQLLMPKMGESINEATITLWHKKVGETIKKDETILEISTDKVDSEIPSPATGTVAELKAQVDDVIAVGEVIAIIETEAGAVVAPPQESAPAEQSADASAPSTPPEPPPSAPTPASQPAAPAGTLPDDNRFYSPAVRAIARVEGLSPDELARIPGTGLNGRVSKNDVLKWLQQRPADAGNVVTLTPTAAQGGAVTSSLRFDPFQPYPLTIDESRVEVLKLNAMRRGIAEHMVRSIHVSPHVHVVAEVDVTEVVRFRERAKKRFQEREGIKLTFTPFLSWAVIQALREHPILNASMDPAGDKVYLHKDIHLGMATAIGNDGLLVPVVRHAEEKSFVGLTRAQADLAQRARTKSLSPDEVKGSTFSITNNGQFGIMAGFPIINQPAVAILAAGSIKKMPVVMEPNDAIAVRSILYLTLSFDHRVVDGAAGGHALLSIVRNLESFDFQTAGLAAYA